MLFNSFTFLIFIAIFLPFFFNLKGKTRLILTLIGSYVFYGWWDIRFLSLIMLSTFVDYHVGQRLHKAERVKQRNLLLTISLGVNLGLLCIFKYLNFFIGSFQLLLSSLGLESSTGTLNIILPVGISFYTFQTMSYTIDIYRRQLEPEQDWLKFSTFVAFFPQLVAGPIVRAKTFLPQFDKDHSFSWSRFISGFTQILYGFFKKVVVADSLAVVIDLVYDSPLEYSSLMLIIIGIFYAFQIYCDFSGYSDIAIGLARIMGFDFPENFRTPYFSKSFSEFWRRWHISLSTWLRDYLYISLGGNRKGIWITYRNLMITMLLGGLWHGANWTFIVWGGLHGMYLVIQRLFAPLSSAFTNSSNYLVRKIHDILAVLIVFVLTTLGWYYFRLQSIEEANMVLSRIIRMENMSLGSLMHLFNLVKGGLLIALLLFIDAIQVKVNLNEYFVNHPIQSIAFYSMLIWAIAFFGTFGQQQFIYFQF